MNNLEKISLILNSSCDIAFTPLQLNYIQEKDNLDINKSKIDYLWCYILINKDLALKLQYKIQPDELEFFILDNEKIKTEPVSIKTKNLYFAQDKQEFFSFCEHSSKNNKEIKGLLPLFLSSVKHQFQEKFPNFLFECEMIIKQKNTLLKVVPTQQLSMSTPKRSIFNKLAFPLSALNPHLKNTLSTLTTPNDLDTGDMIDIGAPTTHKNKAHKYANKI